MEDDLQGPRLGLSPSLVPVSNSEMKCFKRCRRKWWLDYYRGLESKRRKRSGALALGTRVHEALEQYYALDRPLVSTYVELASADRYALLGSGEYVDDAILEAFDSEAELGRIMLEGYLEWAAEEGIDETYQFVAAEKKVSAPFMDGRVELRGKLDMKVVRKYDGVRNFIDFKTAASLTAYDTTAHMDEQLMLYQLLESMNGEEQRTDGGIFRILKKSKRGSRATGPFYRDLAVRFNKSSLSSMWMRLHGTIFEMLRLRQQLDQGSNPLTVAYPTPTNTCVWECPFYSVCPLFDDGSAAEEMLKAGFTRNDPYARYENTGATNV